MHRPDILRFLSILGAKRVHTSDVWVNASCPLASVSHIGGVDRHPSFGILINSKGESLYRCFTCSDPAPLSGLIHNLWACKIPGWKEAMRFYGDAEIFNLNPTDTDDNAKFEYKSKEPKVSIPDRILDKFPLLESADGYEAKRCSEYLSNERGINKHTQDIFSLRYNPKNPREKIILFPRIDKENKIWWLRARSRSAKVFFSITSSYVGEEESSKWGDSSRLFGEQFLDSNPVLIVESETDVLRLHSLGVYNVVATGGNAQKAQLGRLYQSVRLLGFDADIPGLKNKIKAEKFFKGYATLFYLDWKIAGIKDAGELESKADFDRVYNSKVLL